MRWVGVLLSSAILFVTAVFYIAVPTGGSLYI